MDGLLFYCYPPPSRHLLDDDDDVIDQLDRIISGKTAPAQEMTTVTAVKPPEISVIGVTNLAYDATTDLADDDNSAPYVELGEGGHHAHPVFSADDREMTPPPPARPRAMSKREFLDPITRLQERQRTFSEMTADEVEEITKEITMVEMRKPVADKDSGAVNSFLQAFSLVTNMKYVFRCKHRDDGFPAMNGLRVLNLLWLVCMHTNFYCIAAIDNYLGLTRKFKSLPFQAIVNGNFAVDTFFTICGFLVCYWTVKKLNERGDWGDRRFWILNFYVHRLWRVLPLYSWSVLMFTTLFFRIASGPMFTFPEASPTLCIENYWTNLLFINNFLPKVNGERCLGWTWFIACMMQFYFVSPVFILMLRKNWKIGGAFVVACIAASMVTTGVLTVNYGLPSTYLGPASVNTTDTGIDHIYTKPYTRISPFLVGVLLGYYFAVTKNRQVKINPFVVVVCWLLSITVALLVVFGLIDHYSNILDPNYKSVLSKAIYNSCARFAWSLTIAWTIFACATGNGGIINVVLSWRAWIPLGRISFAAYILHPALMYLYYLQVVVPIHYDDWTMIYYFAANIMLSSTVSLLIACVAEFPMNSLSIYVRSHWGIDWDKPLYPAPDGAASDDVE